MVWVSGNQADAFSINQRLLLLCGESSKASLIEHFTGARSEQQSFTNGVSELLLEAIGSSNPENIAYLFSHLIPLYPNIEFGAHLHTTPHSWFEKVDAAYNAGCRRFDGAIQGFGGCPMAKDELTGNMPTEKLLSYFTTKKVNNLNALSFESAHNEATKLFSAYH